MNIIPAIDIMEGKCVRLHQGNFSKITQYNNSICDQVNIFYENGFKKIHIIDLDAAKTGTNKNIEAIKKILENKDLKIQFGGGIRDFKKLEMLLSMGFDKLLIGTAAIINKHFIESIKKADLFDRIIFALDFKVIDNEPYLLTDGWTKNSGINLYHYLEKNTDIKNILATDISMDGTMNGPNTSVYKKIKENYNLNLTASGGVSSIRDIKDLISINCNNCVIGKAIYEKRISLNDLIALC
jgi:phosphoribosylformimino-5-aminoimidazole carboxamide ribotide isomerase